MNHYLLRTMTEEKAAYTHEEVRAIRHMLDNQDAIPNCPRCNAKLLQEGPLAGGGSVGLVWRMSCEACDVAALIAESMSRTRSHGPGS